MCGIVAIYAPDGRVPAGAIQRATNALAHRGPDGRGAWQSADSRVALGHARLALVDPDAAQPLASEDESLRIVVNGEFYDYPRIQGILRDRGHRLRTRSDSEIAVHLHEDLGSAAVTWLRGEFAYVLWDERHERLHAVRDRFGIKPLFYAQHDGVLYLASEAKAILACGVPAAWDETTVYQALHLAFDPTRSLFAGIRQVPPGHQLIATRDGVRLERYWDIPFRRRSAAAAPVTSATIERIRERLVEAVRLRMQADVPVGYLLSGGIDSSTVLAIGSRHSERRVAAFTIGFDDPAYDESDDARSTAAEVGADLCVVRLDEQTAVSTFAEGVRHGEMVQFNAHGSARYVLSREIQRAGYKTVMAGEGADELFGGYAFVRQVLAPPATGLRPPAWLLIAARLLRPPTSAQRELATISPWLSRVARGVGAEAATDTLLDRLRIVREVLHQDFVARFRGFDPYRSVYESLGRPDGLRHLEPARALLYLWLRTIFVNYHMAADRLDMAHAVEVRLPYLDHVLFEEVCAVPASELARNGQTKGLLREAAGPYLPASAAGRVKKPFLAPPLAATPGTLVHDFVQDTLRGSRLPFVDRRAVVHVLDGLAGAPRPALVPLEALLMALVSLTLLDEHYFAGQPNAPLN